MTSEQMMTINTSEHMMTTMTSEHIITTNDTLTTNNKITTNMTSLPFIIIGFVILIIFGTVFWLMAARLKRKRKRITETRVIRYRNTDSDEIPNESRKKITKKYQSEKLKRRKEIIKI